MYTFQTFKNPRYKKEVTGHSPHRFPLKERLKCNRFRSPHVLPEHRLKYLTSYDAEKYWNLCQDMQNLGVVGSKSMSVPAKVLLFLMRLRQGHSFQYLATLFDYEMESHLSDIFWEIAPRFFSEKNQTVKMWQSNISDQEFDQFIQTLIDELNPLYK